MKCYEPYCRLPEHFMNAIFCATGERSVTKVLKRLLSKTFLNLSFPEHCRNITWGKFYEQH